MLTKFCKKYGDEKDLHYEIVEHYGVLKKKKNGFKKEVNLVKWNGGKEKVDIREWNKEHDRMARGVTLTKAEARKLSEIIARMDKE